VKKGGSGGLVEILHAREKPLLSFRKDRQKKAIFSMITYLITSFTHLFIFFSPFCCCLRGRHKRRANHGRERKGAGWVFKAMVFVFFVVLPARYLLDLIDII